MCWRSRLAVGAASVALVEACDPVGVARCGALGLQEFLGRLLAQPVQLIRCPALQAAHKPVTLLYKGRAGLLANKELSRDARDCNTHDKQSRAALADGADEMHPTKATLQV